MKKLIILLLATFQISQIYSQEFEKLGANDSTGRYIKVNDIVMYFECYGSGHPLLLVHGNNGSMKSFYYQVKDFSKKFKVYAVDSRAQGKTSDSSEELSYAQMASDLAVLLDSLGLDSVYYYGHSDGAIIGLELAYAHPEKIKKMVIGSGNFLCDSTAIFSRALDEVKKWEYNEFNPAMNNFLYEASKSREEDSIKFEKLKLVLVKYPNFTIQQLIKIKTPSLILAADHDLIRDEHTLTLFRALPNSYLCILPGTTHVLRWEKPELVNQIVSDFFLTPFKKIDRFWFFEK
ncbi:MAG: hypothetical protein A2W99_03375 [Bacteroidetes bacterium GWF2_33_16]|nr:MAG: hypothetical protein A2X00_11695 [Bacteroidetes bacterium GWE2_32_14]OFY08228.1 MAG: hypothetical protein A2W99_03375 [Bacteroidetes bacterium GWF2_33_16]